MAQTSSAGKSMQIKIKMEIEKAMRQRRDTYICESTREEDVPCVTFAFM